MLPRESIVSFAGVDRVFIVKDNKAAGVRVNAIERVGEHVAVTENLASDTPIILRGDRGVAEGVPVVIGEVALPTTSPAK
jgi:hypothetical protein